jgi:electron transport complex protein RnfG
MRDEPTIAPARNKAWKAFLGLTIVAVVAAMAVSFTEESTRERIQANQLAQSMKTVAEVLPADVYNNEPHLDSIMLVAPDWLGSKEALPVYRARLNGSLVATALTVVAPDGYVGSIRLLVGINTQGRVLGVRVLEHHETPGLGDKIELDKSDWMQILGGRDRNNTVWALRRDGGDFDRITGATITSRAVVNAVRRVIEFYLDNQALISESPIDSRLVLTAPQTNP